MSMIRSLVSWIYKSYTENYQDLIKGPFKKYVKDTIVILNQDPYLICNGTTKENITLKTSSACSRCVSMLSAICPWLTNMILAQTIAQGFHECVYIGHS